MYPVPATNQIRLAGAIAVIVAVLFQVFWLGLPAILISVALLASFWLWVTSDWRITSELRLAFVVAIVVFIAHVAEEFVTGFHHALPALFGRGQWTDGQFLVFNGVWLLVFCISAYSIRPVRQLPVLTVLFFAVAGGVGNGIVHLLLVIRQGEYFPGAWTAPFCLIVGVWLLRLLYSNQERINLTQR